MSKYKVEFKLKQHTPIIHFQSDQSGATLRATELKPKFDRFLKKYAFDGNVPDALKIDKSKDALNYKVKILSRKGSIQDIKNKTYFGNMGKKQDDSEYRKQIMTDDEIIVCFISFHTSLLENIEKFFASFLACTNFGTRQSKGFGSFYLDKKDPFYESPKDALDYIDANYIYADYKKSSEKVFSHVEVIYPLIKTGINYPDYAKIEKNIRGQIKKVPDPSKGRGVKASYYKSYLFQYMLQQIPKIGNEKRFIKENFFRYDIQLENDGVTKKYVRALLGVADGVEFKDYERRGKIKYENSTIKRFKSPLTFKIIDSQLFIIAHDINKELFKKEFTFSHTFKSREKENSVSKTIKTPDSFDIVDFLNSFADYFNTLKIKQKNKNMFDMKIEEAKKVQFIKVTS